MCLRHCIGNFTRTWTLCPECAEEVRRDATEVMAFNVLAASDPARQPGHEYATEGEHREYLDATAPTAAVALPQPA